MVRSLPIGDVGIVSCDVDWLVGRGSLGPLDPWCVLCSSNLCGGETKGYTQREQRGNNIKTNMTFGEP
ncbi:hypothetical protein FKM82_007242 [Ascaphus truei]